MGPYGRKRACCVSVSSLVRSRTTPGTPRGLLWGANGRRGPACCGWGGRGNTLRGCDLCLPVGEQEVPLPHQSSADHPAACPPVPGVIFWHRHGGHSSPCWFVPPCLARAQWPKTHLSSLLHLCPGRAGQTHVDQNPLLSSFRCRSLAPRDLVQPRASQSGGKGVHPGQDPRSLAFPPSNAKQVCSRTMSIPG